MIRINLLPVRQARKLETARRELTMIGAVAAVVLVASLGAWVLTSVRLTAINDENAALQAEINRLQEDVKRVDEMEKVKTELQRKLDVIAELESRRVGPVHMLDELALATPDRVYLTTLREKPDSLEISGVSVSNEVISQFLRALDASAYLDSVYLNNIEALPERKGSGPGNVVLKKFELTARLVTPKDEAAKKDGDAAQGAPAPAGAPPPASTPAAPAPAAGGGA